MTSDSGHEPAGEFDRAVALAGFLAERGVGSLLYETDLLSMQVNARDTDLPRLIVELAEGRAIKSETPPRFRLWREAGILRLESEDTELFRVFGA